MKNIFCIAILCILASACGASQASLTQEVAQGEAAFTSAVTIINDGRRQCVLKSEDAPGCYVKADIYNTLVPIVHGADDALDRAKSFAVANQLDQSETWLETATRLIKQLDVYLDPIKKALGIGG